jgi:hypothetical protein
MQTLRHFFSRIARFFRALTTPTAKRRIRNALVQAANLIEIALPIVELVAAATPSKADDEIVALIRRYALPIALPAGPMTDDEKSVFLRRSATELVKRQMRNRLGVPDHVVDLGVQAAFTLYKTAQQPK